MIIFDESVTKGMIDFNLSLKSFYPITYNRANEKLDEMRTWLFEDFQRFPSMGRLCTKKCLGQNYTGTIPNYPNLRMKSYKDKKSKYIWWFSYVVVKKDGVDIDESDPSTYDIYIHRMCSNDKFKNESIKSLNEKRYHFILKRITSALTRVLDEYRI